MNKITKITAILIITLIPSLSYSAIIAVNYEGAIQTIGTDLTSGGVNIGNIVTGQFSYDSETPDSWAWSNDYGVYRLNTFDIAFGDNFQVSSVFDTHPSHYIKTQNDMQNGSATNPADAFTVRSESLPFPFGDIVGDTLNGYQAFNFQIGLRKENATGQLWGNDDLPGINFWSNIDMADFTGADWGWMNFDGTTSMIRFSLTNFSLATVPEPSTMALMCAGLFGFGFFRRKIRK